MTSRTLAALAALASCAFSVLLASDHSDAPTFGTVVRQDANLTDLHAFPSPDGRSLVLALSTNVAVPVSAASYVFPSDVTYEINVDVDSPVDTSVSNGSGGVILEPGNIGEDFVFSVRFTSDGAPRLKVISKDSALVTPEDVSLFTGLRDDPFIRIPRDGRNVASIVVGVPLAMVAHGTPLLIWGTAQVKEFEGPFQELVGRSLRSMFAEQAAMNVWHPRQQHRQTGIPPDVMVFDTSKPAAFPNGRALTDDVVLQACMLANECRVYQQEVDRWGRSPTPRANDRPFLDTWPYLASPHPPQ